jgi:hypothetical protein
VISTAPIDGTSNELCDWLELAVLASSTGRALLSAVNLELEIEADFEPTDIATEDEQRERRIQQVLLAIEERGQSMPTAYPFERDKDYLVLRKEPTNGGVVYLFCLIVSNGAANGLLHGEKSWQPDLARARALFQACATVSAAGYVHGPSYSVGWPRPDSSSFLDKLKTVYAHFGDGRPHITRPTWAPVNVKDDEIDVIAWKYQPDGQGGTTYLIVQAASGNDWREKSVKSAIDVFHKTWFLQIPSIDASPGIAIPFLLPSKVDADPHDHNKQEELAGQVWRTARKMGVLLFRHRIANCTDIAAKLSADGISPIEQLDEIPNIRAYVEEYRARLQEAKEAFG